MSNTFFVVPQTDKGYVDSFEKMRLEGGVEFVRAQFADNITFTLDELSKDKRFAEVLAENATVFKKIKYSISDDKYIIVDRLSEANSVFDKVTVVCGQQSDHLFYAKLFGKAQRYLNGTSLHGIGNLLGVEAQKHFEAREVALARLEKTTSTLLNDVEKSRQERDREFHAKENALETKFQERLDALERDYQAKQSQLETRHEELEKRTIELDDRAAKHARRQHYKDLKDKFDSWSKQFEVTKGTSNLRASVFRSTIGLMLLFGGIAGWFLFQSISTQDNTHFVNSIVKQVIFTALFVATASFFIRWNNQWFQRHANEEFRLKRMELDIDRASWFVELAFEWKDEKGEGIPQAIIDRLTQGLFLEEGAEPSSEPHDSLAQALLGASRFTVKLADGTAVEYDRKGLRKLLDGKA